jgi:hypothetical protein
MASSNGTTAGKMAFLAQIAQYSHDGTRVIISRFSSCHDGKELGVPDSLLLIQVIVCLTFIIIGSIVNF